MNDTIYNGDSLATRTTSGFPLSIGSGMAFEAIFTPIQPVYDPEREVPFHVNLRKYQECWINLSTMFRNMTGAIQKETFAKTTEQEFKDTLLSEIEVIESLFQSEGLGLCRPVFYTMSYEHLRKSAPKQVQFREDKTDNQRYYTSKHDKVMHILTKDNDSIFKFDTDMKPPRRTSSLILTHTPYDLLSHGRFDHLTLLESHSGSVKERNKWYTKYYPVGQSDLSHLPFLRKLLLVFGDRVLISPGLYKLREQIIEIAHKRHWLPSTTESRIMQELELDIKEPFVVQYLRSL